MGTTVNGSRSWLMLGGMSIQPSEFAKLAVVLGMGLLVAERFEGSWRRRVGLGDVLGMLAIAGVPAVLILLQRSEEHTSELQSLMRISYAVLCLKKKKTHN